MIDLGELLERAQQAIAVSDDLPALDAVRVSFLGKKGELTLQLKQLGTLPADERREAGAAINTAKQVVQEALAAKRAVLEEITLQDQLKADAVDVSLAGRGHTPGNLHPVTRTRQRIEEIFCGAGFSVFEGPQIEDDFHNFTALNIPENHPARAMHDTFYFPDGKVLRTHTSPVQIRTML